MKQIRVVAVIFFLLSIAGLTDLALSNKGLFTHVETYKFRIYGGCTLNGFKAYSLINANENYELAFHKNVSDKSYIGFDEVQKGSYLLQMFDYFGNIYEKKVYIHKDTEIEYNALFKYTTSSKITEGYEAETPLQIIYTYGLYDCGKEIYRLSSQLGSEEYIVEHVIEIKENTPLDFIRVEEYQLKKAFLEDFKLLEDDLDINTNIFEKSIDDISIEKVELILNNQKKVYLAENAKFSFIRDFEALLEKHTVNTQKSIIYLPIEI